MRSKLFRLMTLRSEASAAAPTKVAQSEVVPPIVVTQFGAVPPIVAEQSFDGEPL